MHLTLTGWLLVVASIVISALLVFRLQSQHTRLGQQHRGTAITPRMPAAVFLLVASIGAAATFLGDPPGAAGSRNSISSSLSQSGPDGDSLARLETYARSIATDVPAPMTAAEKLLPDVETMTERLAARLEMAPNDLKGWQTLGWSYFHTARFEQAAAAYAKALEIDPDSAEIKLAYDEAKAKSAEGGNPETASTPRADAASTGSEGSGAGKIAKMEAMPPHERGPAIRSMVDGLAARLESAPRDIEGWTRLMRSRVVLGEKDVAATALRRALDVFKDDSAASGKIMAAAIELGVEPE